MAASTVTIQTTQNVSIDYDLASVGARIGAFLLDYFFLFLGYLLMTFLLAAFEIEPDESILVMFGLGGYLVLYFFLMETFNRGQTLGKMIVGLKVIRLDGRDPTPGDILARAFFQLLDVYLTLGMIAVILVATGRNRQRLGDMTAGTVVISANTNSMFSLEEIMGIRNRADYEPRFPNVQRFTDQDMMVVKQTLSRVRRYKNAAHREALRKLSLRIADQLGLDANELNTSPEQFLETVLMDYIVVTR